MNLIGTLSDVALDDLIRLLFIGRRSGTLRILWPDSEASLIFQRGLIVSVSSSDLPINILGILDALPEQQEDRFELAQMLGDGQDWEAVYARLDESGRRLLHNCLVQSAQDMLRAIMEKGGAQFSFDARPPEPPATGKRKSLPLLLIPPVGAVELLRGVQAGRSGSGARRAMSLDYPVVPMAASHAADSPPIPTTQDFSGAWEETVFRSHSPVSMVLNSPVGGHVVPRKPITLPWSQGVDELIVVDDDARILAMLCNRLREAGYSTVAMESTTEARNRIAASQSEGRKIAIICDLIIPRMDGSGVLGGVELLEWVRTAYPETPFVLLTDYEHSHARKHAAELGIQGFLFKPKKGGESLDVWDALMNDLSVLLLQYVGSPRDPKVEEELERVFNLDDLLADPGANGSSPGLSHDPWGVLHSLAHEMRNPDASPQVGLMILRVASEFFSRACLFLVRKDDLIGLGGLGIHGGPLGSAELRHIHIPRRADSVFTHVLMGRGAGKYPVFTTEWNDYLIRMLGGEHPSEAYVAPVISGGSIAAILYGDAIPQMTLAHVDTRGVELFLLQAGLLLDRILLERELRHGQTPVRGRTTVTRGAILQHSIGGAF
ncbi:MAG: hypothetical protein GMKNLPBB_01971 [Myxococcota bacterium]|nr:hypothetical protein [Myxococcota bacterium]